MVRGGQRTLMPTIIGCKGVRGPRAQEGTSQTVSQLAADFLLHLTAFYKL